MNKDERDELRALADAATPGPWLNLEYWDIYAVTSFKGAPILPQAYSENRARGCSEEDARFIAVVREAVPTLLDDLDAADAEIAELRAYVAELNARLGDGPI